ncbi:hypothetical protein [Texcoconibacillus texcoconensis]|uniref:Uncharacterized protein n=1 Tax=Texcoconibacillus texcoconensis TaxID=1095777 RepID=A0A840QIY3_9BACI|nr:hypothetical protein [Texcoconibacillus texcoconensis]MBB5171958.1 hypothetical protein [Texcoconibacillus texcoconensis]
MKIFITLLLLAAIIMAFVGVKKQNRQMTSISAVASVGLLVLYFILFQF